MKWILLALAAAAVGTGIALQLNPPQAAASRHMGPWMERLDENKDGSISRAEYVQISDGLVAFDVVDLDGSGAIGQRELEVFLKTVDPMWTFPEPD